LAALLTDEDAASESTSDEDNDNEDVGSGGASSNPLLVIRRRKSKSNNRTAAAAASPALMDIATTASQALHADYMRNESKSFDHSVHRKICVDHRLWFNLLLCLLTYVILVTFLSFS
jgi:hypothetical protein